VKEESAMTEAEANQQAREINEDVQRDNGMLPHRNEFTNKNMKLIITSDIHCNENHWDTLYKVCLKNKPDVVTIAGDLYPKTFGLLKQNFFFKFIEKSLKQLSKICCVVLIPGNDDNSDKLDFLLEMEQKGYCYDISDKVFNIKGYDFVGCPWVNDHPFGYKYWVKPEFKNDLGIRSLQFSSPLLVENSEIKLIQNYEQFLSERKSLYDTLIDLSLKVNDRSKSIWLIHAPPYESGLDTVSTGVCVGSKAVRKFIEEYQPLLTLHGHIHESFQVTGCWKTKIKDTLCINAGQENNCLHYIKFNCKTLEGEFIYE
jgi:Icc-related predicted phosphoesterase